MNNARVTGVDIERKWEKSQETGQSQPMCSSCPLMPQRHLPSAMREEGRLLFQGTSRYLMQSWACKNNVGVDIRPHVFPALSLL